MNVQTALRMCGEIALTCGGTSASYFLWRTPEAVPFLAEHERLLASRLAFLRLPACARSLVLACVASIALSIPAALFARSLAPVAVAAVLVLAPDALLRYARERRLARLEQQLDGWLVTLANALRATPSLGEALASSIETTSAPLAREIDLLLKEYRLGLPLDQALDAAALRIGSRTLTALLLTLRIARSSGGAISDCLERAASTLREMLRLDGVVRSKTAEGKAQAVVIAVLPAGFFPLIAWLDPELLVPIMTTPTGHLIAATAAGMWLGAVLLARKIVQVDV